MERYLPSRAARTKPILFVHGNFHGSWCWRNLLTYFANRGTLCYAVNFRGHWLSDGHASLGEAITEDYVWDTEECLRAISAEVILVGHSMGGIVCQKVAENNRVKSLVLLDSAPCKVKTEAYFQPRLEMN